MNLISRASRTSSRTLAAAAAALALSFGAAYTVYAADAADTPAPGADPGGPGAPWHHHGGFMMGKELTDLHTRLKLTPEQDKLWQSALDTMKRDRTAERANHEKAHTQFQAMQQQPILDLNALHAALQQAQQDNARLHEETATAWLAVYNALDDQQKTMVSGVLKQHFARMEQMRQHMHERWQRHGGASEAAPASPGS